MKLKLILLIAFLLYLITPTNVLGVVKDSCSGECGTVDGERENDLCFVCSNPRERQSCQIAEGVAESYICKKQDDRSLRWDSQDIICSSECADNIITPPPIPPNNYCQSIQVNAYPDQNRTGKPLGNLYDDSYLKITIQLDKSEANNRFALLYTGADRGRLEAVADGNAVLFFNPPIDFTLAGPYTVELYKLGSTQLYCNFDYTVINHNIQQQDPDYEKETAFRNCSLDVKTNNDKSIIVTVNKAPIKLKQGTLRISSPVDYNLKFKIPNSAEMFFPNRNVFNLGPTTFNIDPVDGSNIGNKTLSTNIKLNPNLPNQHYEVVLTDLVKGNALRLYSFEDTRCQITRFRIGQDGKVEVQPTPSGTQPYNPNIKNICDSVKGSDLDASTPKYKCINCVNGGGIWSALGCIKTDMSGFVSSIFKIGLGLAGGIALLFIIYGGFVVMTSAGNPERIQQGREMLTSAIAGLILIIFSVFILNLVANDILKIPFKEQNPSPIPRNVTPTVTPAAQTYCCTVSNLAIYQCPFGQNSGICSIALDDGRTFEGIKCNARCDVIATPIPNTCEQNGGSCKTVCGQGEEQKTGTDWVCNLPRMGSDVDICCKAKTPDNTTLPSANSWNVNLLVDGKEENSVSTLNNRSFILEAQSQELKAFSGKILTTLSVNSASGSTIVYCKEPTQGPLGEVLIFMNIPQEVTLPTSPFSGQINIFASYSSCPNAGNYNSILINSSLQKTKDIQFNLN